jgi:hypothetical protein
MVSGSQGTKLQRGCHVFVQFLLLGDICVLPVPSEQDVASVRKKAKLVIED